MKLLTFALACFAAASIGHASETADRVARMDDWLDGLRTDYHTSGNSGSLAWGEAHVLHTAMTCYHATGDRKWLRFIANHADTIFATAYDVPDWADYDPVYEDGYLGWGSTRYSDQYDEYMVHEGYFCTAIAQFVALVYENDELWEEFGDQAAAHLRFMRENVAAKWLSIWDVNRAPDAEWQISYRQWGGGLDRVPHNQYAVFGNMLLFLDDAVRSERYRAAHPDEPIPPYLDRAVEMGEYFAGSLVLTAEDAYIWRYHDVSGWEDISHGNLDARFAWDLFTHGVVFDSVDARRFGRAITERMWNQDPDHPRFSKRVDGSGNWEWSDRLAGWSLFAGIDPLVWHIVDRFVEEHSTSSRMPVVTALANVERWRARTLERTDAAGILRLRHLRGMKAVAGLPDEKPEVIVNTEGIEPFVQIVFDPLPEIVPTVAKFYDTEGSLVRTLTESTTRGRREWFQWDCRDDQALPVASGLYRCALERGVRVDTLDVRLVLTAAQIERREAALEEYRTKEYAGLPPEWWHIGPFPFVPGAFQAQLPPEREIDLDEEVSHGGETYEWRRVPADGGLFVDLRDLYDTPGGRFIGYSAIGVELTVGKRVELRIGRNDYATVWVNGEQVYHYEVEGGATLDDDVVGVTLPEGLSTILVKCGDTGGAAWGFYFRILDERGREVDGLRWVRPE